MIDPTSVPVPSDAWVAARRDHLLAELRRTSERRAHRRLVGGMGALAGVGVATAAGLLIAGGPAASTAFAGWRSAPTVPAPGQLPAAESTRKRQLRPGKRQRRRDRRQPRKRGSVAGLGRVQQLLGLAPRLAEVRMLRKYRHDISSAARWSACQARRWPQPATSIER